MTEAQLIEQILLNLGDKAPWLLAFFIFVRWMWPDLRTFFLEYLKIRDSEKHQPDLLAAQVGAMNTTLAGLGTSLQMFIDESRRSQGLMQGMVQTVVGLVRDVTPLVALAASPVVLNAGTTARISNEQPGKQTSGEASGDKATRPVQT